MEKSIGSSYRDVDAEPDAEPLASFLRATRVEPHVLAAKRRSFALCQLAPGGTVLDVGCGTGEDVVELAELVAPGGMATGVDRSERLISEASRMTSRGDVSFRQADATRLPFPDGSFDACRADRVIQHIDAADDALTEMRRVVRASGVVVVSEVFSSVEFGPAGEPGGTSAIFAHRWTPRERRAWVVPLLPLLMRRAGLIDISVERHSAVLTDVEAVTAVLDLERLCAAAVVAGSVTTTDTARWRSEFEARFLAGGAELHWRFFDVTAARPATMNGD